MSLNYLTLFFVGLLYFNFVNAEDFSADRLANLRTPEREVQQLLWVKATEPGVHTSKAQLWEYRDNVWQAQGASFDVSVGRRGTTSADNKREGDGHTPEGLYSLWDKLYGKPDYNNVTEFNQFFEISEQSEIKMNYVTLTDNDIWIDDARHSQYNRPYTRTALANEPRSQRLRNPSTSFEVLRRTDGQYDVFAVVDYNMNPIERGKGSAIFVHIWREENAPTAGCVAMPKNKMTELARWLDPAKKPYILIGELEP